MEGELPMEDKEFDEIMREWDKALTVVRNAQSAQILGAIPTEEIYEGPTRKIDFEQLLVLRCEAQPPPAAKRGGL